MKVIKANKRELKKVVGDGDAQMLTAEVFVGKRAAEEFLKDNEARYKGKFVPYVLIRDVDDIKNPKVAELKVKSQEKKDLWEESVEKADIKNFKAKLITCPKCGSKINKDYIVDSVCPVCSSDMRNPNVVKRLEKRKAAYERAVRRYEIEQAKHQKDAPLKYGVF